MPEVLAVTTTKPKKKTLSGYCGIGSCEGTKPVSYNGMPMKVCEFWDTCSCKCHQQITEMYEMVDAPRPPVEQSAEWNAWVQEKHQETRILLDQIARDVLSNRARRNADTEHERTGAGDVDSATGTPAPRFAATPTGRRAKGQLEYDVLKVCADFIGGVYEWEVCTPKLISEEIGKMHAMEPPSTGAIDAVLDRWQTLEFALRGKKPSRFVSFVTTDEDLLRDLELKKGRAKRARRMGQAEAKRGSLRPRGQ